MTRGEFQKLLEQKRKENPIWFELESEPPPSDAELTDAESRLACALPNEYKWFVKEFGGGHFALVEIYFPGDSPEWDVFVLNDAAPREPGLDFLAISENGVGDLYGFVREDEGFSDAVFFWDHETDGVTQVFSGFLDFVTEVGLER